MCGKRETERERDRQRETDRERQIERDRQRETDRERQRVVSYGLFGCQWKAIELWGRCERDLHVELPELLYLLYGTPQDLNRGGERQRGGGEEERERHIVAVYM